MKFYIGMDSSSGQEFNNKEDFLKELSLMIDDCEANGGTQFDITVDADANCFDPNPDDDTDEKFAAQLAGRISDVDSKRSSCPHGFWGSVAGEYGTGYYCKKKKQFVSGIECLHCLLPLA
jgi:hypothetical protein